MRCSIWVVGLLATAFLAEALPALAQPRYTLTWLGNLGGANAQAYDINDLGQVAGYSLTAQARAHAFIWDSTNGMQDIGTLGGVSSIARGINNASQVVGSSTDARESSAAFVWENGQMQTFPSGAWVESAYGISDLGQAILYAGNHSYFWENGQITDLGGLGGHDTRAYHISNSGLVVGSSSTALQNEPSHAFIWKQGRMTDLGTLGGPQSAARSINDVGQIVGSSNTALQNAPSHAFLWQDWLMYDLGTLGGSISMAYDINNSGQVIGHSYNAQDQPRGFLWQNGVMYDLNNCIDDSSSDWRILNAYAINNHGQIVGHGRNGPFLLTPVPEPSGLLVLACGFAVSGGVWRRNRTPTRVSPTIQK